MRQDIPEGADFDEMPRRLGYGRIVGPYAYEWYATLRLLGWRLFVVVGRYPLKWASRGWLSRDPLSA